MTFRLFFARIVAPVLLTGLAASCGGSTDTANADGGVCVAIDVSTYDQSCNAASDCIVIQTGNVCSEECVCGSSTVNASEEARYNEATSGLLFSEFCDCPPEPVLECTNHLCVSVPP
jgi:hypothetical protein